MSSQRPLHVFSTVMPSISDFRSLSVRKHPKGLRHGDEVEVDFDSGMIYNRTKGTEFKGQAFPEFMQKIIKAEGLISYINGKN